jgi:two-component system, cell cycle response regulator
MIRKILLIDDDRLQFKVTEALLANFTHERYELEWAGTYEEGVAKLLKGGYAACLLDYQLGASDGLQLLREATARECRTPIVFLTSETADRVDLEAMNAGAHDYLIKGEITPRQLERSLRYAVKLGDTLEALRQLASRDQLTGLLNRREFDRLLPNDCQRARHLGPGLGLLMVDIDHFKAINDAHGHPAGDAVLQEVARRITAAVRSGDRVARFGGEEFALALLKTTPEGALEVAERVRAAVAREPIAASAAVELAVTVSAGLAFWPAEARTEAELISAADRALYAAKQRGRNRVVTFAEVLG